MSIPPNRTARWIPLESNPTHFTNLLHDLGFSSSLQISECESFGPDYISAIISRPILGLILCYPDEVVSKESRPERQVMKAKEEGVWDGVEGKVNAHGEGEGKVWWISQKIYNACGLYAILHAALNGEARRHVEQDSIFSQILTADPPLPAHPDALQNVPRLHEIYDRYALTGDSDVPDLETCVDHHYTCFVKVQDRLVELNGDLEGPVDHGELGMNEDVASENAIQKVRTFLREQCGDDWRVSLMVLGGPRVEFE